MGRGAPRPTIHGVTKESDMSQWLNNNNKSFQSIIFALFWLNLFLSNLFIWHYCTCFLYFIFGLFIASGNESYSVMSDSLRSHGIVHGTLQARILEWVAVPFSRGSSQPRGRTQVSYITSWATREALLWATANVLGADQSQKKVNIQWDKELWVEVYGWQYRHKYNIIL